MTGKKKFIIIGVIVAILVAGAVGAWFWGAQTAKIRFASEVQTFRTTTTAKLREFDAQFATLHAGGANDTSATALGEVDAELTKLLEAAPKEPRVLGLKVASQQASDDANATHQWLFSLKQAIGESREFTAYKSQVLAYLNDVVGKKGSDAEEQQALTTVWKETHVKIAGITPPSKATTLHTELASNVESISATLSSLPELYTKKDYAGFIAKQKELDSKIAGLRSLHEGFAAISKEYDQAIALQLKALKS